MSQSKFIFYRTVLKRLNAVSVQQRGICVEDSRSDLFKCLKNPVVGVFFSPIFSVIGCFQGKNSEADLKGCLGEHTPVQIEFKYSRAEKAQKYSF